MPTPERHLSDGVVVHAHVVARIVGLRLLCVDAEVILAPGALKRSDRPAPREVEQLARTRYAPAVGLVGSARGRLGTAAKALGEADGALESARTIAATH